MDHGIFANHSFYVASGVNSGELVKLVKENGGEASYTITSKTTHFITNPQYIAVNSLKVKQAEAKGVAIVSDKFVLECVAAGKLLDLNAYTLSTKSQTIEFDYEKEFISENELELQTEKQVKEQETMKKLQERIKSTVSVSTKTPRETPLRSAPKVAVYNTDATNTPHFPTEFELVYFKTLQWTDMKENHNKYYALEFHKASENGKSYFRLYTHYGRTDDLVQKPNSGRRECRFYQTEDEAEDAFATLYQEKTSKKGYRPVELVFSNIGSEALKRLYGSQKSDAPAPEMASQLNSAVQDLIKTLYAEASNEISSVLGAAKITSKGIETPLGVVTITQIEKGESILRDLYQIFQSNPNENSEKVTALTNEFYTTIPHNIGRSKQAQQSYVFSKMSDFAQKEELLQLMRDILNVTIESKGTQLSDVDMKYAALKTQVEFLQPGTPVFNQIYNYVIKSQVGDRKLRVTNIFSVKREVEEASFRQDLHNQKLLFHGSRASNFVGLLSRGVLMPKLVVAMGGKRRDAGLLGNGIYFGDSATTSAQYASQGSSGYRFMVISRVALGSVKQYNTVQYGLTEPPSGYHSVQGISSTPTDASEFKDNEFVIFSTDQQKLSYLVQFEVVDDSSWADEPVEDSDNSSSIMLPLSSISLTNIVPPQNLEPKKSSLRDSLHRLKAVKRTFGSSGLSEKRVSFNQPEDEQTVQNSSDPSENTQPTTPRSSKYSSGLLSQSLKLQPSSLNVNLASSGLEFRLPSNTSMTRSLFKTYKPKPTRFEPPSEHKSPRDNATSLLVESSLTNSLLAVSTSSEPTTLDLPSTITTTTSATTAITTTTTTPTSNSAISTPRIPGNTTALLSGQTQPVISVTQEGLKSLRKSVGPFSFEKLSSKISTENAKAKRAEDQLRELFANDRDHFKISDPYVLLINVFRKHSLFDYVTETNEELQIPKLLSKLQLPGHNGCSVVNSQSFTKNFDEFTRGILRGLSWSNIFMAGGSVLGPLMNISDEQRACSFKDSDIDLFIYGLSPEKAQSKVEEIFFKIQANTNASGEIVRTKNAITIVGQYPNRHVQIILRLYKSPAEILMGFDIDCCAIGYDGEDVWALPRAARALSKRYNLVDMTRRSLTYETRLYKYAKRGFAVAVPGLVRHLVKPDIYNQRPWQVHGLAKLLLFEHSLTNPNGRYDKNRDELSEKPWRPKGHRLRAYKRDEFSEDRIHEYEHVDQLRAAELQNKNDHDYSNLYLPWGPQWYTSQIIKELLFRDKSQWATTGKHVVLVGLDAVLSGIPNYLAHKATEPANEVEPREHKLEIPLISNMSSFVEGSLTWLQDNPGRQLMTGSFHPVTDDRWYDLAYCAPTSKDEFLQILTGAAFEGAIALLKTVLRRNRNQDVNSVDLYPSWSKTALHHACTAGEEDCVREILNAGGDVSLQDTKSGLFPLHFAILGGNARVVDALLRLKADVSVVSSIQKWNALHFASYFGNLEIFKNVLDRSPPSVILATDNKGCTPLHVAAMGGNQECIRMLLDHGADPKISSLDNSTPLDYAARRGHTHAAVLLARKTGQGSVTLHTLETFPQPSSIPLKKLLSAVTSANVAAVKAALDEERKINGSCIGQDVDGLTRVNALHIAAARNYSEIVKLLIDEASPSLVNARDQIGQTPLHHAVRNFAFDSAKVLLSYSKSKSGSSFYSSHDDGTSSARNGYPVEVDLCNQFGQSPLYYVYSLLGQCQFPSSTSSNSPYEFPSPIDDLGGLPFVQAKHTLDSLKELLLSHGAQKPSLNYFGYIPPNPLSSFLKYDPCPRPSTRLQPRSEFDRLLKQEEEEEQKINAEKARFEVLQKEKSRPAFVELSPEKSHKRARHTEEAPTSPQPPFSPPKVAFEMGSPKIEKAKVRHKGHATTNITSDTGYAFDQETQFSFSGASQNYLLPPVTAQVPPNAKLSTLPQLEEKARSFISANPPSTLLGRALLQIAKLFQQGHISSHQKDALKTLALKQHNVLVGAMLVFEHDNDSVELVDSLKRICHLA